MGIALGSLEPNTTSGIASVRVDPTQARRLSNQHINLGKPYLVVDSAGPPPLACCNTELQSRAKEENVQGFGTRDPTIWHASQFVLKHASKHPTRLCAHGCDGDGSRGGERDQVWYQYLGTMDRAPWILVQPAPCHH